MKVAKAIEILHSYIVTRNATLDPDVKESIRLGTEALKWIQQWRGVNSSLANIGLPGETKDAP